VLFWSVRALQGRADAPRPTPIWRTGALPPRPSRARAGNRRRPTLVRSKSQSRYVQPAIFAPRRLPSRVVLARRELAPGFALVAAPEPWSAGPGGPRAGPCRRADRFPLACWGEQAVASGRPPAQLSYFRKLLLDKAWTPPAGFFFASTKIPQPPAFQDNVQKWA
jgi:hypothetical protein